MSQGTTEINLVFRDWLDNFAPAGLIESERNVTLLADYIRDHRHGIVTTTTLNQAVVALGSQLEFVREPTAAEKAAEAAKKAEARMQRDLLDSLKPQPTFEDRVKAEKAQREAEAEAKKQQAAQREINRLIDNYTINLGPGRIDYARSEYFREQLRGIKVKKNGKYDAILTLRKVQEALSNLP
jgi:hypothetical protein